MSWGGYIPGHIVREAIEKKEYAVWAELDKNDLRDEFAEAYAAPATQLFIFWTTQNYLRRQPRTWQTM